jgi:hypothetical protein
MSDLEMRTEDAAFMDALAYDGFVVLGGPVGNGARILLIIDAENEETVRSRLDAEV